jgi:hypothetical protein
MESRTTLLYRPVLHSRKILLNAANRNAEGVQKDFWPGPEFNPGSYRLGNLTDADVTKAW